MAGRSDIPESYHLPDLHSMCPWISWCNPHHNQAFAESRRWALSYDVLEAEKRAIFEESSSELLASWTYPYAALDRLRLCCDFLSLLFIVDEISDDQSGKGAASTGSTLLHALRGEALDDGMARTELYRMAEEFGSRCRAVTSKASYDRFLKYMEHYIKGFVAEAKFREDDVVLDMATYTLVRRGNGGVLTTFGMFGCSLGTDLPDAVFENEVFKEMQEEAADLVTVANDIYSYNKEQSTGHYANNILTVLQEEREVPLQEAVDLAAEHFKMLVKSFDEKKSHLPSFGVETDNAVKDYIKAMQCWVSGNLEWSFESHRYFGDCGASIKQSRVVKLSKPADRGVSNS